MARIQYSKLHLYLLMSPSSLSGGKLSTKSLPQFMMIGLMRQLEMDRSSFGWQERFRDNSAEGHTRMVGEMLKPQTRINEFVSWRLEWGAAIVQHRQR